MMYSNDDGPTMRAKILGIATLYDTVMESHDKTVEEHDKAVEQYDNEVNKLHREVTKLKKKIASLITERDQKAARDLTVDSFDDSLDQVSEGQIKSAVDAMNNTIDELVMNITEEVSGAPPLPPPNTSQSFKEPLLTACVKLPVNDERRGLLVETILHQAINQRLWAFFFKGKVCCTYLDSGVLERMHDEAIILKGTDDALHGYLTLLSHQLSFRNLENGAKMEVHHLEG
jgi:predicted phage tail protein